MELLKVHGKRCIFAGGNSYEGTLRQKAEAKHYQYTDIPVESQRYRFVALNEMGRVLCRYNLR